jgi:hypothetical protein
MARSVCAAGGSAKGLPEKKLYSEPQFALRPAHLQSLINSGSANPREPGIYVGIAPSTIAICKCRNNDNSQGGATGVWPVSNASFPTDTTL